MFLLVCGQDGQIPGVLCWRSDAWTKREAASGPSALRRPQPPHKCRVLLRRHTLAQHFQNALPVQTQHCRGIKPQTGKHRGAKNAVFAGLHLHEVIVAANEPVHSLLQESYDDLLLHPRSFIVVALPVRIDGLRMAS